MTEAKQVAEILTRLSYVGVTLSNAARDLALESIELKAIVPELNLDDVAYLKAVESSVLMEEKALGLSKLSTAILTDAEAAGTSLNKYREAVQSEAQAKIAAAQACDCHPKHKPEIRKHVFDLTGGRCAYCDCVLEPEGNGARSFIVEHVVPTSSGGPDNLANYVPACAACNTAKSAEHVLTFIRRRFSMSRSTPQQQSIALTVVPKLDVVA